MENKSTTIPAVGDWIPVDAAGHTGVIIAIRKDAKRGSHYAIIGVPTWETHTIDLPYFAMYSEDAVRTKIGGPTGFEIDGATYYAVPIDDLRPPVARFTLGMQIKVGCNDNDLARVMSITRSINGEMETVTVSMLSGRMNPSLHWSAKRHGNLLDIPYFILCKWEDGILPDTTGDFVVASTSLNGYQQIVPECSALVAHATLYATVKGMRALVDANPCEVDEHQLGDALYHLTQLATACGYDLQDIATQSLADNN